MKVTTIFGTGAGAQTPLEAAAAVPTSRPDTDHTDPVLAPFLCSTDEDQREEHLARLLTDHAEPVIRAILRGKLRAKSSAGTEGATMNDLMGEVLVRILRHLRALTSTADAPPIRNIRSYTAVITYHVFHEYLRRQHSQRSSLKSRLRYLLTNRPRFALWTTKGSRWLAGFSDWRGREWPSSLSASSGELRDAIQGAGGNPLSDTKHGCLRLGELLSAVFDWVGGPLELDQLVGFVADFYGTNDRIVPILDDTIAATQAGFPGSLPHPATTIEHRSHLARVWVEIAQLPPWQRTALLLNLRDTGGDDALALFPQTGVASLREIANLLNLPPKALADLSNELPLEDAAIAQRLGVTRQQVTNFRKSARERLARRLKHSPPKAATHPLDLAQVSLS